jgi:hypothetical protein
MFRASTVATILAGGLAMAACGTDSSPAAPETGPAPSLRTEHSPEGPGARVFQSSGAFFTTVPGTNYLVEIGIGAGTVASFCSGGDSDEGVALTQFLEQPNGRLHSLFRSDGQVPLLLFPAGIESICEAAPVAEGTGLYLETANGNFGAPGLLQFGFRITGFVTDQAGERHHVVVVVRKQFRGDEFQTVVEKVDVS